MAAMTTAVIARPRRAIRREGPLAGTDDIGHSRMMTSERGETAEVEGEFPSIGEATAEMIWAQ
jgi:hypothetical protein